MCKESGCLIRPFFYLKGDKKGLYCSTHKKEGMVNVVSPTCQHEDCDKQPVFNLKGEKKGLYCSTHKKEGMVDVVSPTCKNDWCYTIVFKKYKGYCLHCFIHMFPDLPVCRNYKTKEKAVVDFIISNFSEYSWISDKKILDGCSKRRPDLLVDLGYQILIIEVDENQHIKYGDSCENYRMMLLSQDVGH